MITSRGNARHMHMRAPPDTPTHSITLPARFGCLYVGLEWASNNCVFLWQACFLKDQRGGALLAAPIGRFFGGFSFFFLLEHSFFFFLFCVCLWLCIAVPSKHNALLFLSAFECPHGTVLSNVQNTCRMRCKYTEHACTISNARTFSHSLHARAAQALTHLVLPMCCC